MTFVIVGIRAKLRIALASQNRGIFRVLEETITSVEKNVWGYVSHSPLHGLWDLRGVPLKVLVKRTWNSTNDDNLFGRASQLAYYFFFALFPMLIAASAILGLAAKSATHFYAQLLSKVASLIPPSAFGIVMDTFNQTTKHATPGKITLGLATAIWSASVGVSAIQDTMNGVYEIKETRSYWRARAEAILLTLGVSVVFTSSLALLVAGDVAAGRMHDLFTGSFLLAWLIRFVGWLGAALLMLLVFAMLYFFSPDLRHRQWRWLTPGSAIGLLGWLLGSLGLRLYLHWFNSYSVTYGSLGAVIILLVWFYLSGLMLLLGAEVNAEIEGALAERYKSEDGHEAGFNATSKNAA